MECQSKVSIYSRRRFDHYITKEISHEFINKANGLYNEHNIATDIIVSEIYKRYSRFTYDPTKFPQFHYKTPEQVARDEFISSLIVLKSPDYFITKRRKIVLGEMDYMTHNIKKLSHNERLWLKRVRRYFSDAYYTSESSIRREEGKIHDNKELIIEVKRIQRREVDEVGSMKQEFEHVLNEMNQYISIRSLFLFLEMSPNTSSYEVAELWSSHCSQMIDEYNEQQRLIQIRRENELRVQRELEYRRNQVTYFLMDLSLNIVKIGTSKNIRSRLSSIKTHNGGTLFLIGLLKIDEDTCQEKFEDLHKHGEWYKYSDRIVEFIDDNMTELDKKWCDDINNRLFKPGIKQYNQLLDGRKMSLVNALVKNILVEGID